MDVELQLLALKIGASQLEWHKPVPGDEEMVSFAQVERVEHVADSSVFVEQHVLLHAPAALVQQLILHSVHSLHQAVLQQVLQNRTVDVFLGSCKIVQVYTILTCADASRQLGSF